MELNYFMYPMGIDGAPQYGSTVAPTREGALAAVAALFAAYPDVPVFG